MINMLASDLLSCACSGRILDVDGEMVCGGCGVVAGHHQDEPPIHMAPPTRLEFDGGLTTTIGRRCMDHAGKALPDPHLTKRMRTCNTWTQTYNRSMPVAMAQLSGLRDKLRMTDAASEYAAYLLRKAVAADFLVGRKVSHCTAAVAYMACRKHGMARTIHDVTKASGIKKHNIFKTSRQIHDLLDTKLPVQDPATFVARIGEACGVSEAVRRDAVAMLASADRLEIAGKGPSGLVAAVLYLSCIRRGEMVRRHDIAKAAGVAETTLSNRYNEIIGKRSGGSP